MLIAHGSACSDAGDPSSGTRMERYIAAPLQVVALSRTGESSETAQDIASTDYADKGSLAVGDKEMMHLQFQHLPDNLRRRGFRRHRENRGRHDLFDPGAVDNLDSEVFGNPVMNSGI